MYLSRVEVQGFKSFPRKTVLSFGRGLTAVVGPNGAGKSNIADAIRWGLGEQSSRSLRVQRTEEVIFGGTPKRARAGMAQVTLVFDNSDGWLPLDYAEVSVTRRAYRSGENEYILNGAAVRLRDLQDLLRTGAMGVNGQVVVGQGQIDAILRLKPEDRRVLLEEAAGVSRHYAKRDEARRRLDRTQRNLERLRDLSGELAPRLDSLRLQAEIAERSTDIETDLRRHTRALLAHRLWQANSSLESARVAADNAVTELTELEAKVVSTDDRSFDSAMQEARQSLNKARAATEDSRSTASELSANSRLARQSAEFEDRRIAELSERLDELTALIANADATVERDREALAESGTQINRFEAAVASEGDGATTVSDLQQLQTDAAEARRAATKLASEIARLQESDRGLVARDEEARKDSAKGRTGLAEIDQTLTELRTGLGPLRDGVSDAEARAEQARTDRSAGSGQIAASRSILETAVSEVVRCAGEVAGANAELEALSAQSAAALEGWLGASMLLENADSLHVKGLVRSGIEEVPAELTAAVDVSISHMFNDVVLDHARDIDTVLDFLSDDETHRIRLRPSDGFQTRKRRSLLGGGPPKGPGVVGTLDRLLRIAPGFEGALASLLESFVVVDSLSTAIGLRASSAKAADRHIVTLAGELIDRDGSILVGPGVAESGADLEGRLESARTVLEDAERRLDELQRAEAEARSDVAQDMSAENDLISNLDSTSMAVTEAKTKLRQTEEEINLAERQMAWWQTLVERSDDALSEIGARREQIKSRMTELRPMIGPAKQAVERTDLALSQAHLAPAGSHGARLEIERERMTNLRDRIERQDAEIAARGEDLESIRKAVVDAREQMQSALAESERLEREAIDANASLASQEESVEELRSKLAGIEVERERAAIDASSRELDLARVKSTADGAKIRTESALVRITELRERAEQEHGEKDLEPVKRAGSINELAGDIEHLRHLVEEIGPVNPLAPQQYSDEKIRLEDLDNQIDDMDRSAAELRRLEQDLESAVRGEFMEAFERISTGFERYFKRLVGGGSARMTLTDPGHLATSGLEIDVQLPGKRRQQLAALSGGERALVSGALLFAMIDSRTGPFCVLDEVDAALDDENIVRFRNLLEDFSNRMQIILISHNPGTIETADSVFGVSMAADGISQVVSLRLNGVDTAHVKPDAEVAAPN